MDEFVKNNQNKNIPRTFVNIPITVLSKDEYLTKQLEELKEDRFGSSCIENRTVIPIKIRDVVKHDLILFSINSLSFRNLIQVHIRNISQTTLR